MIIQGNDPYRDPSFTIGHRVRRQVWNMFYTVFFRYSPRPCHRWRTFLLRLFGATLGKGCHIYPAVKIWAPWNLYIGDFVGIGDGVTLYDMDKIEIGDYVVISQGAHLCGGTHDHNSYNFQLIAKPIKICSRVWLCADTFIHPGVTINEGIVVGARAVVTKSLSVPWSVYAGSPAVQVGVRNRALTENK